MKDQYRMDSNKLLWHMDKVHKHFRDGERIYPIHIDCAITKSCNAKCSYCYGIFQQMGSDFWSKEALLNFCRSAVECGVKSVTFTGDGENTLHPNLLEALTMLKMGGIDVGLATNGISLNRESIDIILQTCTWLRFNLSAVSKEGYKLIHGVDKWDTVRTNILDATMIKDENNYDCTIGLQMVLIPDALNQVLPEAEFAISVGVDYFVIKQFSDPGCEEMKRFELNWYNNVGTLATLHEAERMSTEKTKIIPKWKRIDDKGVRQYDHCVDCALLFQISGTGKCYPCGYLFGDEDYCYGDLEKQSLKEILDSDHYWEMIKYMREHFNVHTQCAGCCRHDSTNKFITDYLNKPSHLNFI